MDQLREILGHSISRQQAQQLLIDAEGDINTAVALHFSAGSAEPVPAPEIEEGAAPAAPYGSGPMRAAPFGQSEVLGRHPVAEPFVPPSWSDKQAQTHLGRMAAGKWIPSTRPAGGASSSGAGRGRGIGTAAAAAGAAASRRVKSTAPRSAVPRGRGAGGKGTRASGSSMHQDWAQPKSTGDQVSSSSPSSLNCSSSEGNDTDDRNYGRQRRFQPSGRGLSRAGGVSFAVPPLGALFGARGYLDFLGNPFFPSNDSDDSDYSDDSDDKIGGMDGLWHDAGQRDREIEREMKEAAAASTLKANKLFFASKPFDASVLAAAKARQPTLPFPPSQLALPLPELRLPDHQGGTLYCEDVDKVPESPVPLRQSFDLEADLEASSSAFVLRLGIIRVPLLPRPGAVSLRDQDLPEAHKQEIGSAGERELQVLKQLLHDGALTCDALKVRAVDTSNPPFNELACIDIELDAEAAGAALQAKVANALREAGLDPIESNSFRGVSDWVTHQTGHHDNNALQLGSLSHELSTLYKALNTLTALCGEESFSSRVERVVVVPGGAASSKPEVVLSARGSSADSASIKPSEAGDDDDGQNDGPLVTLGGKDMKRAAPGDTASKQQGGRRGKRQKLSTGKAAEEQQQAEAEEGSEGEAVGGDGGKGQQGRSPKGERGRRVVDGGRGRQQGSAGSAVPIKREVGKEAAGKDRKGMAKAPKGKEPPAGSLYADLGIYMGSAAFKSLAPSRLNGANTRISRLHPTGRGAIAVVLQTLLTHGQGLWLGPDCDGLLNFMDGFRWSPYESPNGLSQQKRTATEHNGGCPSSFKGEAMARGAAASASREVAPRQGAIWANELSDAELAGALPAVLQHAIVKLEAAQRAKRGASTSAGRAVQQLRSKKVEAAAAAAAQKVEEERKAKREAVEKRKQQQKKRSLYQRAKDESSSGSVSDPLELTGNQRDEHMRSVKSAPRLQAEVRNMEHKAAKADKAVAQALERVEAMQSAVSVLRRARDIFVEAGLLDPPTCPAHPAAGAATNAGAAAATAAAGSSTAATAAGASAMPAAAAAASAAAAPGITEAGAATGNASTAARAPVLLGGGVGATAEGARAVGRRGAVPSTAGAVSARGARSVGLSCPVRLPPGVPLAILLAAERVSGTTLLARDESGWVVSLGFGEARLWGLDEHQGSAVAASPGDHPLPPPLFSVSKLLASVSLQPDAAEAIVPPSIRTLPKPFQLQGLGWMLAREQQRDGVGRGLLQLHPGWMQVVTADGTVFYVQRHAPYNVTTSFVPAPVGGTCGGFLCDEMGLGKTLESLMLIVSNPAPEGWAIDMHPPVSSAPQQQQQQQQQQAPRDMELEASIMSQGNAAEEGASKEEGGRGWGAQHSGKRGRGGAKAGGRGRPAPGSADTPAPERPQRKRVGSRKAQEGDYLANAGHGDSQQQQQQQQQDKKGTEWQEEFGTEPVPIKTTLIVMPANLMPQWRDEINAHIAPGAVSWAWFEDPRGEDLESAADRGMQGGPSAGGRGRTRLAASQGQEAAEEGTGSRGQGCNSTCSAAHSLSLMCRSAETGEQVPIDSQDLVLMSYEQLRRELAGRGCPLRKCGFWRIMLDEAQLVANTSSVAAQMASSLWRRHAWVITGTPITSRLFEVQGLCEFLALEPYHRVAHWRQMVQDPYEAHTRGGLLVLRGLLRGVMLRRTGHDVQEQLSLPPCTREDRVVELSSVERTFYDVLCNDLRQAMAALTRCPQSRQENRASSANRTRHTGRVLACLTALRQSCCHPHIAKRREMRAPGSRAGNTAGGGGGSQAAPRMSMRQIMGKLVMQAYSGLDSAVGHWMSTRLIEAAMKDLRDEGPGGSTLQGLEAELAAYLEVASMASVRQAAALRSSNGTLALIHTPRRGAKEHVGVGVSGAGVDGSIGAATAQVVAGVGVAGGGGSGGGGTAPSSTSARPVLPAAVPVGVDISAMTAATTAAGACVSQPQQQPQKQEYQPQQPFGELQQPQQHNQHSQQQQIQQLSTAYRLQQQPQVAQDAELAKQLAMNAMNEEEAAYAAEAADLRLRRWRRLECERLVLIAYVIRRRFPEALSLAALEGQQEPEKQVAEQQPKQQQEQQQQQPIAALPAGNSAQACTTMPSLLDAQEPQPGSISQQQQPAGQQQQPPAAAATRQHHAGPSGQKPEIQQAAARLREARHALNDLRLQLGLEPIIDIDNAELRRSNRRAEQRSTRGAANAAQQADARTKEEDTDSSDNEGNGRKRRRTRRGAKKGGKGGKARSTAKMAAEDESALEVHLRSETAVRALQSALQRKDPFQSMEKEVAREAQNVAQQWREFKHLLHREEEAGEAAGAHNEATIADEARPFDGGVPTAGTGPNQALGLPQQQQQQGAGGSAAVAASAAQPSAAAAAHAKAPENSSSAGNTGLCPICWDEPERRAVTSCGHAFCSDCIHEIISSGSIPAPCPICRKMLKPTDIFDTISEEEAVREAQQAQRTAAQRAAKQDADASADATLASLTSSNNAEYGAKVCALLAELQGLPQDSKAVVFSSWGRLLRLVGEALSMNGVEYASLAVPSMEARQSSLVRFNTDPHCKVLLVMMSTSGGAAGLTLTVADTAFIMEPQLNPGLEAQAAARIYRLGQTRPTRVIRLLAADSVEGQVLAMQKHKLSIQNTNPNRASAAQGGAAEGNEQAGNEAGPSTSTAARGRVAGPPGAAPVQAGGEGEGGDAANAGGGLLAAELDPRTLVRFFQSV